MTNHNAKKQRKRRKESSEGKEWERGTKERACLQRRWSGICPGELHSLVIISWVQTQCYVLGDQNAWKWETWSHVLWRRQMSLSHSRETSQKSLDKSVGHHFGWIERLSGDVRLQIIFRALTIIPSPGREGRRDTQILRRRGKKLEILRRVPRVHQDIGSGRLTRIRSGWRHWVRWCGQWRIRLCRRSRRNWWHLIILLNLP